MPELLRTPYHRDKHPLVIQLRRYAEVFGEFEAPLLDAARRIHLISTTSDISMRERVIEAIHQGCRTKMDIADDTEFDEPSVARIYDELLEDGQYEERPITGVQMSGSAKRPPGIFLKSEPPGNAGDLPRRPRRYDNPEADDDEDEL